jgi:antitoxin VapB
MALNIKDEETERLAGEVAELTGESKTGAVRQALRERKQRILLARGGLGAGDRMVALLERRLWPRLPAGIRGISLSKQEEEAILGYGPDGV